MKDQITESEIQWDCSSGFYSDTTEIKEVVPHDIAMRNLPTNDEGENFYAEMMDDVKRLSMIQNGDDSWIRAYLWQCPWLTREKLISSLEKTCEVLRKAGFNV